MPYIKLKAREDLWFSDRNPKTAGELNYSFTMLIKRYLMEKSLKYQTINDIIGALEGAKAEFYRRIVVPYENKKIQEDGDVYE